MEVEESKLVQVDEHIRTIVDAVVQKGRRMSGGGSNVQDDKEVKAVVTQLRQAEKLLEQSLYRAKQKASAIQKANDAVISSEELIKYAHQLSLASVTIPPTGWDPTTDGRRPYPSDIEMRLGALMRCNKSGSCDETSGEMGVENSSAQNSDNAESRKSSIDAKSLPSKNPNEEKSNGSAGQPDGLTNGSVPVNESETSSDSSASSSSSGSSSSSEDI
eukprot:m.32847 g.32847  ORF g.32847 m.32847 type:complete len:217 (+) comp31705_c0_seq2:486-1136(+)